MPIASTLAFVKNQLDGLPMPGGLPNMAAYITPPEPERGGPDPTAYVWPTDGHESRQPARHRPAQHRPRYPGRIQADQPHG